MASERLSVFPAFHKVSRLPVLVVGSGREAVAKVRLLLETDAAIRLVAETPSAELVALIGEHALDHRGRAFVPADLEDVVLAFAANGEREEDANVVAAARARRIPANAVDIPELCDFYTPAIVNRAPVAVAITSTGAGPVLAQKIRGRIEALLPLRLGGLARLGATFRAAADQVLPKGQVRRRFWSTFFEGRVADAVLAGRSDEARQLASRLLNGADVGEHGFVWLVGAGPGAADLLTLRAQRVLQEADVIVHDALVPDAVIAMGRRDAERINVAGHDAIGTILVREALAGRRVVRLMHGDAFAGEETSALRAAGIPFEIVPGISAAAEDENALAEAPASRAKAA
jgi:uroporphyrin-III C-methyltransferase/precorrin-2 dehydrogenase/sirohydrochlorin ferrochelatase